MDLLTKAEKLRQEQSRLRQKTIELNKLEEPSEEQRAELNEAVDRLEAIEPEIRAATTAEAAERANLEAEARAAGPDGMDAEMRERVSLRSKASLTTFLRAALSGRMVDGAEAELQAAAQLQHGGIPLELWDVPRPAEERAENRDDTATGAPSTVGVNMDMIRPQVFAAAVLPRLGVEMPRVMSGTYATSTISTGLTAGARAKGDARESTAAAFTVQTTTPKSVSARMSIRIEDVASVGAENFESALRQNLALALSDALDDQGLNGNGTDPNLAGFFSRLTTGTDPSNVATFDAFVAAFAGGVDGLWAGMASQVAMVVGVDTYRLALRTFRDAAGQDLGDMAFADYAMRHFGGFWTNERMPAPATNVQKGILHRRGRMGMRTAVCPHWGEVGIDDIYSGSAAGERHFTLHVLLGDVLLVQPAAYSEVEFKVA